MPIYGTPTYLPGGQWAFPRPYIEQVTFGFDGGAIFSQTGGDFLITDGTHPTTHVIASFLPNFWATNSNRYTIDHVLVDWWAIEDPSPTPIPLPFILQYSIDPVTIKPELFLHLAAWSVRYTFALPPPPPNYWTPT